jgi:hypothetical protein
MRSYFEAEDEFYIIVNLSWYLHWNTKSCAFVSLLVVSVSSETPVHGIALPTIDLIQQTILVLIHVPMLEITPSRSNVGVSFHGPSISHNTP